MNILVTGGAGYIGSILVRRLLRLNFSVTIIDDLRYGIFSILDIINQKNIKLIKSDIRDIKVIDKLIRDNDIVIHLAAIVGFPACSSDPINAKTINDSATQKISNLVKKYNKKIIFASSGSIYGKTKKIADENHKLSPLTLYGRTKRNGEKYVLNANGICLRFATLFGYSHRLRLDLLVNDFCFQAYHNKQIVLFEGEFKRTFLHVSDAVSSIIFSLNNYTKMKNNTFNIGSNNMNFTKKKLVERINRYIDFKLIESEVGTDQDKRDYEVSYKKISALGFKQTKSIDYGINELLKIVPYIGRASYFNNSI